jgi:hypothetical protein
MANYLKPGFPEREVTENSVRYNYEYIGPDSALNTPLPGSIIAGRPVVSSRKKPVPGTDLAELFITSETAVLIDPDTGDEIIDETTEEEKTEEEESGSSDSTTYPARSAPVISVDWVALEHQIRAHPELAEMTAYDSASVEKWEKETDPDLKGAFKFSVAGGSPESAVTLSALAQKLARCINRGVDTYQDFHPVVRRSTIYRGSMPGTDSIVGNGIVGGAPPGAPAGWTYVQTADSVTGAIHGGQWERNEEWTGMKELLVDSENILI